MKRATTVPQLTALRNGFYGRTNSVLKQVKTNLTIIETARRVFVKLPQIKGNVFTVSIFGFPNIGKTTLLTKITESKPEINSYPFTTKQINVGYYKFDRFKVQVLDTPGTLNRTRLNNIEKQAYAALKHITQIIIYPIDLTAENIDEKTNIRFQN